MGSKPSLAPATLPRQPTWIAEAERIAVVDRGHGFRRLMPVDSSRMRTRLGTGTATGKGEK
jgi:hypothetical protein